MDNRSDLIDAYRHAVYKVTFPTVQVELRVGAVSPLLDEQLAQIGVCRAALITAYNPLSTLCPPVDNLRANGALLADIDRLGYINLPACNVDPSGGWPNEAAYLIPGISGLQARTLAEHYRQNGWLWCEIGKPVALSLASWMYMR